MEITRGDTFEFRFQRKNQHQEVITEKPDKMYFTVKENDRTEDYIFQKRLDNATISYDEVSYYYNITIEPEDTDSLSYSADTGTPNVDLCYVSSEFTFVGLIGKTQYEIPSDFGTVTSIIDTDDAYRHLYIEDPNIRPLQVGDIIVSNTKFYFNVPDDFRSELPSIYTPSINDIIMLNKNGLVQKMRINYTLDIYDECSIEYMKKSSDGISWDGNTGATIFDLEQEKNLSIALAGDMDLLEASGFVGTITEINTASPAYKYVLVDTTTLGA